MGQMEGQEDRRRRREIQRRGDHLNVSIVFLALEAPPLSPMTSLEDW